MSEKSDVTRSLKEDEEEDPGLERKQAVYEEVSSILTFVYFVLCAYVTYVSIFHRGLLSPIGPPSLVNHTVDWVPETDDDGTVVFSILAIVFLGISLGYLVEKCGLPGLLGMLLFGIALRNLPFLLGVLRVHSAWGTILRKTAFIVILLRGGLSLDAADLVKMKGACLRLALLPCSIEALAICLAAKLIFGLDILFGLLLGFVLAAVSPAVVVPSMISIAEKGYAAKNGICTLVVAAASLDDVYAITLFSLVISVVFSTGASIWLTLLRAPVEVVVGSAGGALIGFGLRGVTHRRLLVLLITATALFYGCEHLGVDSAGALAVLVVAFVASHGWKKQEKVLEEEALLKSLWVLFFQPALFGLIGFELSFELISLRQVLLGLIVLTIGLLFRSLVAFTAVYGSGLSLKERIFVAIAWLPKATVQAALAPVALDLCSTVSPTVPQEYVQQSQIVFTLAVLSILTTAPIGALAIRLTAPLLLTKEEVSEKQEMQEIPDADLDV